MNSCALWSNFCLEGRNDHSDGGGFGREARLGEGCGDEIGIQAAFAQARREGEREIGVVVRKRCQ